MKKDIIYPIFIECSTYASENFWKNIFEELAYGSCPYGSYINKDFICCNYKNKEFSYKIQNDVTSIQLYNDIYTIFTDKLGLMSPNEKYKKKIDFTKLEDDIKNCRLNWLDIKKKSVKDFLLEIYVLRCKKVYNLNLKQSQILLSIIFIAMVFKSITNKDITYIDGDITNIDGFTFYNGNYMFDRDIYNITDCVVTPDIIINKKLMSDNWDRYCNQQKNSRHLRN